MDQRSGVESEAPVVPPDERCKAAKFLVNQAEDVVQCALFVLETPSGVVMILGYFRMIRHDGFLLGFTQLYSSRPLRNIPSSGSGMARMEVYQVGLPSATLLPAWRNNPKTA
jgi:hypothetical protein